MGSVLGHFLPLAPGGPQQICDKHDDKDLRIASDHSIQGEVDVLQNTKLNPVR